MRPSVARPLLARWVRLPTRTIRLRLTAAYGGLFLASAAALLAIIYVVAAHQYTRRFFVHSGAGGVQKVIRSQKAGGLAIGVPRSGGLLKPVPANLKRDPTVLATTKVIAAAGDAQSTAVRHQLLVDSAIALGLMGVLSIGFGWVVAGRALRPLRTITNTAREISASNLHRRLALSGPDDELKRLGTTFDNLLARLERSFEAQRRFVANASHELRTPLTLERTLLEVALADPDANAATLREACERVLAVGEQQERLIDALLTLSRSQRGLDRREPIDLAALASAGAAAVDWDGLSCSSRLEPARTTGDPRLVERLVANLLANARVHNTHGGTVEIATATANGRAVLTVANTGETVAAEDVERIFEPFQRLERERTDAGDGHGLGLSIVQAVADAHDATVTATPRPGGGLVVQVGFAAARERP